MSRIALGVVMGVLVAGCSGTPERPEVQQPRVASGVELLLEVRRAALDAGDALELQPLTDPLVIDLLEQADAFEALGDFAAAERAYQRALILVPDAPGLLQGKAELLLAQGQLDAAELVAARAYEHGPKLGPLCRRSWATVRLARELRGNPDAAQVAREQSSRCTTPPPVRM